MGAEVRGPEYPVRQSLAGATYTVQDGRRTFLVVVAFSRTIVFERIKRPDTYVMRREILYEVEPMAAVTGVVLSTIRDFDPLEELQKRYDRLERSYWESRRELSRMIVRPGVRGKRGKHAGRNP